MITLIKSLITTMVMVIASCLVLAAPASADRLKVVTTFTVIADIASEVAGDAADVVSITKPGAEIHGYQPTPGDLVRAMDADLILWNGLNLELWFEPFLANLGAIPSVIVSEGITPIAIAEGQYQGKANPHAWMGYDNAVIYIENIKAALSQHDPENSAVYARNAEAYQSRLREALLPLKEAIADVPSDKRWLVTCEGAFSYLARDLGMKELYLWPMNADQTGTPQQVRHVIDGVKQHQIPVVFCESTVNTAPAKQVARETGAHYGGVLYVDSLSAKDGAVPSYLDLLNVTISTITDGLTQGLSKNGGQDGG